MRVLKGFALIAFSFLFIQSSFSQEQLGLRLESYSGVNSLALNPANNLTGAFKWDINLVGAGAFGQTNYGFIYNTNISEIIRLSPNGDVASNYTSESQYPSDMLIVDFYDDSKKKYLNGSATILGPSVSVKLESGHTFGVFTNVRTAVSAQGIPSALNYYFFDRQAFGEEFEIAPFIGAGMSWSELGINYGRRIEMASGNLDVGGSLKFLNGYEAFFMNNNKSFGLTQFPGDTLAFSNPDFEYGLTTSNATGEDVSLSRNGGGVAIDLGAVFTIDGYEGESYQWKFGAALLDIGKINFTKDAQSHKIDGITSFSIPFGDYDNVEDVDDVLEMLSEQSIGTPGASLQGRNFDIWLPGALSLQADYNVIPNVFVNATLIQRMPSKKNAIKRGNLLAITPRFEHRWLSAALPVSLYNYQKLRVGAAIRLAFISIGTENLTSFIGKSNFTGSDIYFAVKVNPFNIGLGGGGRIRGGKSVKCYDF